MVKHVFLSPSCSTPLQHLKCLLLSWRRWTQQGTPHQHPQSGDGWSSRGPVSILGPTTENRFAKGCVWEALWEPKCVYSEVDNDENEREQAPHISETLRLSDCKKENKNRQQDDANRWAFITAYYTVGWLKTKSTNSDRSFLTVAIGLLRLN